MSSAKRFVFSCGYTSYALPLSTLHISQKHYSQLRSLYVPQQQDQSPLFYYFSFFCIFIFLSVGSKQTIREEKLDLWLLLFIFVWVSFDVLFTDFLTLVTSSSSFSIPKMALSYLLPLQPLVGIGQGFTKKPAAVSSTDN